jgi:hypothetical protein
LPGGQAGVVVRVAQPARSEWLIQVDVDKDLARVYFFPAA